MIYYLLLKVLQNIHNFFSLPARFTSESKDILISATESFHLSTKQLIALLKGTSTLGREKARIPPLHSPHQAVKGVRGLNQ